MAQLAKKALGQEDLDDMRGAGLGCIVCNTTDCYQPDHKHCSALPAESIEKALDASVADENAVAMGNFCEDYGSVLRTAPSSAAPPGAPNMPATTRSASLAERLRLAELSALETSLQRQE